MGGHPIHPALTHFPIGLLCTVPVWDGLALWTGAPTWWLVARATLGLGLLSAVPAGLTGFLDFVSLPAGSSGERIAVAHLTVVGLGAVLSAVSFLLRLGPPGPPGRPWWTVGLALAGAGVLGIGGWLGAELTFGHGVGVRDGHAREAPEDRGPSPDREHQARRPSPTSSPGSPHE